MKPETLKRANTLQDDIEEYQEDISNLSRIRPFDENQRVKIVFEGSHYNSRTVELNLSGISIADA